MLLTVVKAVLAPLYLRVKEVYLKPDGTSQTIQAILFSAGQKFLKFVTGRRVLAAVVGEMVAEGRAVPDGEGRMTMVPDIVIAGEVMAADKVEEMVWVMVMVPEMVQ